jgi:hypothetical protein
MNLKTSKKMNQKNHEVRLFTALQALDAARDAMRLSLAAHERCLPQIQGVLPIQDTELAISSLKKALNSAGEGKKK